LYARRWRKTLQALKMRYRRPYTGRHSSVRRNLTLGRNLLWTAKQHDHRTVKMLQTYAAWIDNAVDTDVYQIRRSMGLAPTDPGQPFEGLSELPRPRRSGAMTVKPACASAGMTPRHSRHVRGQPCSSTIAGPAPPDT
jgi:hypothetical protein